MSPYTDPINKPATTACKMFSIMTKELIGLEIQRWAELNLRVLQNKRQLKVLEKKNNQGNF
jgi:hypothetical protein